MKKMINLGKSLSKAEQKKIIGGYGGYCSCNGSITDSNATPHVVVFSCSGFTSCASGSLAAVSYCQSTYGGSTTCRYS